ncbi:MULTISPECIES: dihydrolipoyl dehydrogenase [Pseudomonas]|uniref:Dihydrolipoyl dehydrogenase n=1 Tax=Pseudomonas quercus TaxID=2722792 RepID=A0ABX0YFK1_9PSED|nr:MULTISPECIES: dihydrolipoyl dehydrogenase [Pseudomonas]MBF7143854.1 dihydrolipoyl dehydrogenase [Pseudomonas sp. LY10J]NJP02067.1 dihydrolipoyl dehydrogenase [Pseudomonas quercus]
MNTLDTTLLVLGGGPGGYVAAIRAGQLGIPTVLVEGDTLGGTCLNVGCIPSKALIHVAEHFHQVQAPNPFGVTAGAPTLDLTQAIDWKNTVVDRLTTGVAGLLRKHKVKVIHGHGQIVDGKTVEVGDTRIHCQHLVLATGSCSVALPSLPLGGAVVDSTGALAPTTLPRHLAVVGGGYIGLELGIAYRKLGVKVTVIEAQPRLLPTYDAELTQPVIDRMLQLGITLLPGHAVEGYDPATQQLTLRDPAGSTHTLDTDRVLVAAGRVPRTTGYGLERLNLTMAGRAVRIDDTCRTSMTNVWAVGDLTGEPLLAHRAMAQGEMVAEVIAGHTRAFTPAAIAAVCYTDPEIVVAGQTPEQAGAGALVAMFPFAANGRAMTLGATAGFVRVVARSSDHLILGWQAVGPGVSELAAAFSQSLELGARLEDIAGTVHAHPTLGEAVQEAAMRALGQALHI